MSEKIGLEHAYLATYDYLNHLYSRTQSPELGTLLSEMSVLNDGSTADPAAWSDWLKSVQRAIDGKVDCLLRLR